MTGAGSILMIHGLCCGGEVWSRSASLLRSTGWHVDTPTICAEDRPTSAPGASTGQLTLEDYVADMAAAALRLEQATGVRPVIIGHSLGALIAQKLAEKRLARALVLLAPGPPAGTSGGFDLAPLITFANLMFIGRAFKLWRFGFEWGLLHRVPRAERAAIYAATRFCSRAALYNVMRPEKDPQRIAFVDETKVDVPILTVGAALDRAVPVGFQRQLAAKYSHGDYVEFPDCGHWLIDEPGTDRVMHTIQDWLQSRLVQPDEESSNDD
jgi:pimeloyl-ACP methyl ester carboxylesterase